MVSFITPVVARNRANECVDSFVIAAYSPFIKADDIFGAVSLWGDPTKAKNELGWNPQSTSFEELVKIMVSHDMQKVAAEHVANVMRTNLAEYLEKGIVK